MDPEKYLRSQGWKPGQGLRADSIKKPLLVKHRKDNKGLGHNPMANEGWWERVFDGHLKSLDAFSDKNGVSFSKDEEKLRKAISPLYTMFRHGGVLEGTIEVSLIDGQVAKSKKGSDKKVTEKTKDRRKKEKKQRSESKKDREKSKKERKSGDTKTPAKKSKNKKRKSNELDDSPRKRKA